jgi:hypothetical protein
MFSNYFIVLILKIIKKYKKFILMNEDIKSFGKTISFWNKNKNIYIFNIKKNSYSYIIICKQKLIIIMKVCFN